MAKDYNELEQLVNDVTNIDTARMTLRWALERLNAVEKERAELKKNLTVAEEAGKGLEIKVKALQESFSSRSKTLDEKEDFYGKLEATMALLGEGKLDIQQLLKKEAKLDQLRRDLENEYQDKFEELDKSQASLIERWNQRLLGVEEQYAKRLSEAQNKYDSLRSDLEADYQGRLAALENTYRQKEKDLTERIKLLEASVKAGGDRLEGRKKELEAEFIAKKNEIEGNYIRLRGMLEANLDDRARSLDAEHADQVRSLEKSWGLERSRLLEETRIRDEQFAKAQEEIAALEAGLAAQQEKHHRELMAVISEKEQAFKNRLAELEREKAAFEAAVAELARRLEQKESDWVAEKERLQAEFLQRSAELDASVKDRAAALEKEHAARAEEFKAALAAAKEGFEKDADSRVAQARRAMETEKARLAEAGAQKDAALEKADAFIKDLERALSAAREGHQRELMEKISSSEEAFRAKLAAFEAERAEYQAALARKADEAAAMDARAGEMRSSYEARLTAQKAELDARLTAQCADYEAKLTSQKAGFEERIQALERKAAELKEEHNAELLAKLREKEDAFAVREAALAADLESRKAAFAAELAAQEERARREAADRLETERSAWQSQVKRLEGLIGAGAEDFRRAQAEIADLSHRNARLGEQLLEKEGEYNRSLVETRAACEKELDLRVKDLVETRTSHIMDALEAARRGNEEAAEAIRDRDGEIERLKADLAEQARAYEERIATDESMAISGKLAELETAFRARKERLDVETAALKTSLDAGYQTLRDELNKDFEVRSRQAAQENEALRTQLEKMRKDVYEANVKAEGFFNDMMERKRAHQEELKQLNENHLVELHTKTTEAVAKASEALSEKLYFAEEGLVKLQKDHMDEMRVLQDGFVKEKERMVEELDRREQIIEAGDVKIAGLENEITRSKADYAIELRQRLAEQEEKFGGIIKDAEARRAKADTETEEKTAAMKAAWEAKLKRTEDESAAAMAKVTESLTERLYAAEEGMLRLQKDHMDELRAMQDGFLKEKERLVEDLSRREACIETGDLKIAALENELMKFRQDSAAVLMNNLAEQEDKFNAVLKEYHDRMARNEKDASDKLERTKSAYEARLRGLEEALQAKEERHRADGEAWSKKLREQEAEFSARVLGQLAEQEDRFNGLLKDYHARQEKVERDAAVRLELAKASYEAKLRELEEVLRDKDGLLRESEELFRRKHAEMDERQAGLNAELFGREQKLAGKEKELNDRHLELEREYSVKAAEIEKLRIELVRVISDYKSRK